LRPAPQPTQGAPYTHVNDKAFMSHFGLDTLRDLPDFEALEDAGLLSKDKLLAGDIMPTFAGVDEEEEPEQGHFIIGFPPAE